MNECIATSADGTRIAYEVDGEGPAILLLHGGFQNRQVWSSLGYVERLKSTNKVVSVDLRGHGQSERPFELAAYTVDKLVADILAVADACKLDRFVVWGYSYGGNIARYLAAQSTRIEKFIMIGATFGTGASGEFRQSIIRGRDRMSPLLQAQREGKLDVQQLSPEDQPLFKLGLVPWILAWMGALLEWPINVPADLRCSTLWLVGTNDAPAMAGVEHYRLSIAHSKVQLAIIDGLNHEQELTATDSVFPTMYAFTRS